MSVENQEALDKAMEELDDLEKSVKEEPKDELDELTKSLEEELGDELTKSHKEPDGDEDDKGAEPVGQEEEDGEGEADLYKSTQDENYDEELVKASDAFASLEKSVQDMTAGLSGEVDSLKKSVAALLNLNIKQAKVIASLAKSRHEDMERIEKSVTELGAKPLSPGQAKFGIGGVEVVEELTKSISDISESLTKAVQAGKVDARYLSIYGTYKDVARLPEDVKKIIGL
jgi:t-SNARE complex subunit (syntaxin)